MDFEESMNIFDNIRNEERKLKPYKANGKPMSQGGKYARGIRSKDEAPQDTSIIPYRTLPPQSKYQYGADKQHYPTVPGPYYVGSKPMVDYGPHRPVWRGWRPKRPRSSYKDLSLEMPVPQRTYKIETDIPTERELIDMASRNATAPYPTVPGTTGQIPDPYREYGIFVRSAAPGMAGMGQDDAPAGPSVFGIDIAGVTQDVLDIVKLRMGKDLAELTLEEKRLAAQIAKEEIDKKTKPAPEIPWGTLAIVAAIGVGAIFILPKVLR